MNTERRHDDPAGTDVVGPAALDQTFTADNLFALRNAVAAHGSALGLPAPRVADLVLLAHELASNAVRHGGAETAAPGRLRLWLGSSTGASSWDASSPEVSSSDDSSDGSGSAVFCEVSDQGPGFLDADQAGTEPVAITAPNGRGLWIVRQVADEVRILTGPTGTTITAALRLPA